MKFSSSLTILFLRFLLQQTLLSAMADIQLIKNTCKGTRSSILCLKILLADPKSQNADLTGLALIGVDAVNNKGLNILKQIVDLKKSRPELRPALDHSVEVYHVVVDVDVPSSRDALRGGVAKFAEDGMADSAVEAQACERSHLYENDMKMGKLVIQESRHFWDNKKTYELGLSCINFG